MYVIVHVVDTILYNFLKLSVSGSNKWAKDFLLGNRCTTLDSSDAFYRRVVAAADSRLCFSIYRYSVADVLSVISSINIPSKSMKSNFSHYSNFMVSFAGTDQFSNRCASFYCRSSVFWE